MNYESWRITFQDKQGRAVRVTEKIKSLAGTAEIKEIKDGKTLCS